MSWRCSVSERARRRRRCSRGAVTAELAMALPLLVAVTLALVWMLSVGLAQIRIVDAARETARAVARGDPTSVATALGTRVAPPGSAISVQRDGERVVVTARAQVTAPGGWLSSLPGASVVAEATALIEEASPQGEAGLLREAGPVGEAGRVGEAGS